MVTKAAIQEYTLLEVFQQAGGSIPWYKLSERITDFSKGKAGRENITVYPRGIYRVVDGFLTASILEISGTGDLTITERGLQVKKMIYDTIVPERVREEDRVPSP